jgi:hypothetical protein
MKKQKKLNSEIDLSFVAKYQYPALVKEHFEQILSHIDVSKVESVILTGSTSRGELSYQITGEGLSLYSDYEIIVIAKKSVDKNDELRLSKCFGGLECNLSNNPLFHIDFSYINKRQLRNLPFYLKHYETYGNGVVIYGQDRLSLFPKITLKNLDFKDLNEILIWRLWSMLLYFPAKIMQEQMQGTNEQTQKIYKYVLCRNFLDLITWVLPIKGILRAGFRQRYLYLKDNFNKLCDDLLVDERFLKLAEECMVGKFEITFTRNLIDLYSDVIEYFIKAKRYLLSIYHIEDNSEKMRRFVLEANSGKLFNDYHYKRKGHEALFILKKLGDIGVVRGGQWLLMGKYGLILEFLIQIHSAMISNLNNDKEHALYCLNLASSILQKLTAYNILKTETKEFSESWPTLRFGFAHFMMEHFHFLKTKKEYINSVLR